MNPAVAAERLQLSRHKVHSRKTSGIHLVWAFAAFLLWVALPVTAWGQAKIIITAPETVRGGKTFWAAITVQSFPGIDAFGFELRYNESLLTFNSSPPFGAQKGALIAGFDNFLYNKVAAGTIRVGGYGVQGTQYPVGILCQFSFTANKGVDDIAVLDIRNLVDFPQAPAVEPCRITIRQDPLVGSGMSVENGRGRRSSATHNSIVWIPIEATWAAGSSIRGALSQILYDSSVLEYMDAVKGDWVPSDYVIARDPVSPGTLNLGLSQGSENLSPGDLWKVQFRIKPGAALGRSSIVLKPEFCFFLLPDSSQVQVVTLRNGSVTVFPTGDANRDGSVTIADVLTVVLAAMYYPNGYADEFTDCNQDLLTNNADIICTMNALFSRGN